MDFPAEEETGPEAPTSATAGATEIRERKEAIADTCRILRFM
ncbi:hypothetical protein HMPREF0972_00923 [Actinomyces sp. oral taxon 848 str. F0332]|nr:hypothetical protein HMPREF0972_00923 [Actinomyces sp. oral taxon 848 str. F0332]